MKNKDVEKLLKAYAGDIAVVNGKWKCKFSGLTFNGWKNDNNSPSQDNEAYVNVVGEGNDMLDGCIVVHRDEKLADKLYAFLYLKKPMDEKWAKMLNVTSLSFDEL